MKQHDDKNGEPSVIYIWFVDVPDDAPGERRIRKWDVKPFPEGKAFVLSHAPRSLSDTPTEQQIDRALAASIPGGSRAEDWFLPHASEKAKENVRDVVAHMLAAGTPRSTTPQKPLDMLLFCPRCGLQHVDAPKGDWTNPPHATHTCQGCGLLWRPSNGLTNGVSMIDFAEDKHIERANACFPGPYTASATLENADAARYRWLNRMDHFLMEVTEQRGDTMYKHRRLKCGEVLDRYIDEQIEQERLRRSDGGKA